MHILKPNITRLNALPTHRAHLRMRQPMLSRNRTNLHIARRLDTRMRMHLGLMMSHARLRNRTHIALLCISCARVVWREYSRRGAYDRADGVVHGLCFRVLDCGLEDGAFGCGGGGCVRDRGVLVQVVVVVCCCTYDGAGLGETLAWRVEKGKRKGVLCTWPSLVRSTSG